jgi:hypothetical protein
MIQTVTGPRGPSSPTAHVPSKVTLPPAPTTVFDAVTDSGTEPGGATVVDVVVVLEVVVVSVVELPVSGSVVSGSVGSVVELVELPMSGSVVSGAVVSVEVGGAVGVVSSGSVEVGVTAGSATSFDPDGPTPLSMKSPQVAMAAARTTVPTPPNLVAIRQSCQIRHPQWW